MADLPKGIRERGAKFLVDVTVNGRRRTKTVGSIEEALLLHKQMREGKSPIPAQSDSWTLGRAIKVTTETRWRGTKAERTAGLNAGVVVRFFGADTKLDDITTEWIDEFVSFMARSKGNSNTTINRKLACLSVIFTVALERGGAARKPKIPRKKEGKGRIRYLTKEEELTAISLLDQWTLHDHAHAVAVLADTGIRMGELLRLEVRDVHWETGMIHIWETKAEHPRSVPMTTRVQGILKTRSEGTKPTDRLFPFADDWMRGPWNRLRASMGLHTDEQFVPHALRHTCASRLAQGGVGLDVVQKWLGHKTIQMTLRYSHLCPTQLTNAVAVLEG